MGDSYEKIVSVLPFTTAYYDPRLKHWSGPSWGNQGPTFHYCVQREYASNGPEGLFADRVFFICPYFLLSKGIGALC